MFKSRKTLIDVDMKSDVGKEREVNEDFFDFRIPHDELILVKKGRLFGIADGMGGHAAGDVASQLGLEAFIETYYADEESDSIEASLRNAVLVASECVRAEAKSDPELKEMGSTLTAAVFVGQTVYIAHVGDSRAYLLRGGELKQITEDHSWVGELCRQGALTEQEAREHPMSNVITQYLGMEKSLKVGIYSEKLNPFDIFMLGTDGLFNVPDAKLMKDILARHNPSKAVEKLVELANELDGSDNITAIVVSVRRVEGMRIPIWGIIKKLLAGRGFHFALLLCVLGLALLLLAF